MTNHTLDSLFQSFSQQKALIIGDVMIDAYTWGRVERISPEAPVPVVHVTRRERRLGGAANVALNVLALGATPLLCAVVGDDLYADAFEQLLNEQQITHQGIVRSSTRITTVKERVLSGSQQMLRVDSEQDRNLTEAEEEALLQRIRKLLPQAGVVIFEDYDKGVLSEPLIQEVIRLCREQGTPTVVDPKKRNFFAYSGATLFKPNLKELREGLKLDFDKYDQRGLEQAVSQLKEQLQLDHALITLSERGMFIDAPDEKHLLPAHVRSISDVSGAGDTVVSIAALCLAQGLAPRPLAELANLGGGLVCESVGVVPIDKNRLYEEAKKHQLLA